MLTSTRKARRVAAALTATAAAVVPTWMAASPAAASTDYYCNSCVIYDQGAIQDAYAFYLTVSYVHYLGIGDRYLAASAVGFNWVYGYNEVSHDFNGTHLTYATAGDFSGHDVTVNAHADY